MRRTLLICLRDYVKYVTRRGFILGVLLFPVWVFGAGILPTLLSKNVGTRTFAVVDLAGGYREAIAAALDRSEGFRALAALADFAAGTIDLASVAKSEPEIAAILEDPYARGALDKYLALGGWQAIVAKLGSQGATALGAFKPPKPKYVLVPAPPDIAGSEREITAAIERHLLARGEAKERFGAVLVLPADFGPGVAATYWTNMRSDAGLGDYLQRALSVELRLRAALKLTSERPAMVEALRVSADIVERNPEFEARPGESAPSVFVAKVLPIVLAYILFFTGWGNAAFLLGSVIEEKSTRMVEILMSSASPYEIMIGKLVAAIATSFTTFALWGGGLVILGALVWPSLLGPILEAMRAFVALDTAPFIALYFLCGLLIYSAIFMAIGSMAASIADAQALSGPATLVLFFPNFFLQLFMTDPDGLLPRVLSWIPIYAPTFMLLRLSSHPTNVELWGTAALSAATAMYLLYWMSRVFAANILTTERPPKLSGFIRRAFRRRV